MGLNEFLTKMGKKYKEWKAKEPERRAVKMQRMKDKIEELKLSQELEAEKSKIANIRNERAKEYEEKIKQAPDPLNWNPGEEK